MKIDLHQLENYYRGFSYERLSKLDPLGRDMTLLLLMGNKNPSHDPRASTIWQQWWAQEQDVAWGGVLPKRTPMGQLNQVHRALMQVGLDISVRTRPSQDPLFLDTGLLCRLAGMNWPLGLEACLEKLGTLSSSRAKGIWKNAFVHSIECNNAFSSGRLVKWANQQGWGTEVALIDAEPLATAWLLWTRDPRNKKAVGVVDNILLDQSLTLSRVGSDLSEEKIFWSELVNSQKRPSAAEALSAWCARYPDSWDRMHALALTDNSIHNAWLLACQKAQKSGINCDLWKTATNSHTRNAWLRQLGWGEDERLSPLAAWWAFQASALKGEDERSGWSPGSDEVSSVLRQMGVVEPGSAEDVALGGKSFVFAVLHDRVNPSWFENNTHWARNDPIHNSNPIFESYSTSAVDKWIACGFSPSTINDEGETAIVSFISGRVTKNPKSLAVWLGEKFKEGSLPTTGRSKDGSLIEKLSLLRNEDVLLSFVRARLNHGQPPPTAQETQELALHCSAPVVHEWCSQLKANNLWSETMNHALWRGLPFRDPAEDHEIRADLVAQFPFSEDEENPLWIFCLSQSEQTSIGLDGMASILGALDQLGAIPMSWNHEIWLDPTIRCVWANLVTRSASVSDLVPLNAPQQWWANNLDAWMSATDMYDGVIRRNASQMQRWLHCGLPLCAEVIEVLSRYRHAPEDRSTGDKYNPWWSEPSIQSALQHASLSSSTSQATHRPSARRF